MCGSRGERLFKRQSSLASPPPPHVPPACTAYLRIQYNPLRVLSASAPVPLVNYSASPECPLPDKPVGSSAQSKAESDI